MANGERSLAASVILRAIKDAYGRMDMPVTKQQRQTHAATARAFLRPDNPDLAFYCAILDLDPVALCEAVEKNGAAFMGMLRRSAGRVPA